MAAIDHGNPERLDRWLHALCRIHGRPGPSSLPEEPDDILLVDLADGYWTVRNRAQVQAIGLPPGYRPARGIARDEWIDALDAGLSEPRADPSLPGDRPPAVPRAALPVPPVGGTPVR